MPEERLCLTKCQPEQFRIEELRSTLVCLMNDCHTQMTLLGTVAITHKIWVPGAYFNISETLANTSHTAETIFQVFAGKQQLGGVLSKQARRGEIVAD